MIGSPWIRRVNDGTKFVDFCGWRKPKKKDDNHRCYQEVRQHHQHHRPRRCPSRGCHRWYSCPQHNDPTPRRTGPRNTEWERPGKSCKDFCREELCGTDPRRNGPCPILSLELYHHPGPCHPTFGPRGSSIIMVKGRTVSAGMYLGARLLSIEEIALIVRRWKNDEEEIKRNTNLFRIPLFAEHRSRQIAMELIVTTESTITNTNIRSDTMLCHHYHHRPQQHGRIVLISPLAPFGPHYKVLANSWEGFLTLM